MILVYCYRVKLLNGLLNPQSRAVNYVWNICNDTQKHALKWGKKWPTGVGLNVLTTGSSKALGIRSGKIIATCEQYAKSRSQHRRPYLRYRGRKALGWVPLKDESGSTRSCSTCGSKDSATRPKGIAGLGIRERTSSGRGVLHDRDANAALNIFRCARASPVVFIYGRQGFLHCAAAFHACLTQPKRDRSLYS
ncbi:zinc ribbon domain-containing protein [Burkholderia stagnalis]|uniref:zinc ribbon domain-containing protein n=1 Tax=Burkholderia stagnalis TaxID=1503054 RepID=UPI004063936D